MPSIDFNINRFSILPAAFLLSSVKGEISAISIPLSISGHLDENNIAVFPPMLCPAIENFFRPRSVTSSKRSSLIDL